MQTLTTMVIELETFKLEQQHNDSVVRHLGELQVSTRHVIDGLRRTLYELRGETGVEEHFAEAVRELLTGFSERTHIDSALRVSPTWPKRLPAANALHLYRTIEEALSNVKLHSGAEHVVVALTSADGSDIAIEVTDDGLGMTTDGKRRPGLGLIGMRERALILSGRLEIDCANERGTTIRAVLQAEGVR